MTRPVHAALQLAYALGEKMHPCAQTNLMEPDVQTR